jgi:hypothetical protein
MNLFERIACELSYLRFLAESPWQLVLTELNSTIMHLGRLCCHLGVTRAWRRVLFVDPGFWTLDFAR